MHIFVSRTVAALVAVLIREAAWLFKMMKLSGCNVTVAFIFDAAWLLLFSFLMAEQHFK